MNGPRVTPAAQIQKETRKLLLLQCVIIAGVAVFMFFYKGQAATEAAVYGGMMAVVNTWLSGRRTLSALLASEQGAGQEVMILALGAIQRFAFTVVFFVVGMLFLKLMPVPLLACFALAQGAYFFSDAHKLRANLIKNES